ncbi:MAG: mnhB [Rickettsiaceae bacterium]|jgi:multicomponent Na+:H+ antiporter subunit B|nr:mnhB [Rickettsiaceae bacterium]
MNENISKFVEFFIVPSQIEFTNHLIFISLACIGLIAIIIKLVKTSDLLESILYLSLFSIVICLIYLLLDSPDVAMTEAAIGVCVSTVILLVVIIKVGGSAPSGSKNILPAIITCSALTYLLIISGQSLIEYGTSEAPLHQHQVAKHYIENTGKEIGINSIVAAILASYRGFDTLGETLVIFTAGIIVTLILSYRRNNVEKS